MGGGAADPAWSLGEASQQDWFSEDTAPALGTRCCGRPSPPRPPGASPRPPLSGITCHQDTFRKVLTSRRLPRLSLGMSACLALMWQVGLASRGAGGLCGPRLQVGLQVLMTEPKGALAHTEQGRPLSRGLTLAQGLRLHGP